MTSIKQNPQNSMFNGTENTASSLLGKPTGLRGQPHLPDFTNVGILIRIVLGANLMVLIASLLQFDSLQEFFNGLMSNVLFAEIMLFTSLIALYFMSPRIKRLSYRRGIVVVVLLEAILCMALSLYGSALQLVDVLPSVNRALLLVLLSTGLMLYYFHLRHQALSPAVTEARLQALQARIRPHFLFNCINAVLSMIRSEPKRAETALEDMADLFRVLMSENRELVPLANEIALCRQYLALEKLRLEERLKIQWQIEQMPPDALIPPLLLQPLLENAVYHGIEPMPNGGVLAIQITVDHGMIQLVLSNPIPAKSSPHPSNKMAIANIRERLALHFDVEASLTSNVMSDRYEVHIRFPYQHAVGKPR